MSLTEHCFLKILNSNTIVKKKIPEFKSKPRGEGSAELCPKEQTG